MFNSDWYLSLRKPPLAPPDALFMPVWIFLYILIFISLTVYIFTPAERKLSGYIYFSVQMLLNFMWTGVFFGLKNISGALAVVIFMIIFTVLTAKKFYSVSAVSGLLLMPYIIWITFALYLNAGYLILNQQ